MKSIGYSRVYYRSETEKIKPKVVPWIEKFGSADIIDVGCGTDKITLDSFGIDGRPLKEVTFCTTDIYNLYDLVEPVKGRVGIVYSSHVLEHLHEDVRALNEWVRLTSDEGIVFLYLPDDRYYDNDSNREHVQKYTYPDFVKRFEDGGDLSHFELIDHGEDVGFDRYSFYIVFRRGKSCGLG